VAGKERGDNKKKKSTITINLRWGPNGVETKGHCHVENPKFGHVGVEITIQEGAETRDFANKPPPHHQYSPNPVRFVFVIKTKTDIRFW